MYLEKRYRNRFKIASKGRVLLMVSTMMSCMSFSYAAPTGGVLSSGSATISSAGTATTIDQSSTKAVINWQDFSIAKNESVTFNQPSSNSMTLNRVVGSNQSVIDGLLSANGKVYLVNQNGILISKDAKVNTAGFLASTLNITDENFNKDNFVFEGDGTQGNVINLGAIEVKEGGYVVLLGKQVVNEGTIIATKGMVSLNSGDKITLNFNGNSLVDVTIDQGTLDALVETKQAIIADGGKIILTAKAADDLVASQVNIKGLVQAQTVSDLKGEITAYAYGGTTTVEGTLDASAPTSGNGGFIETSGDKVKIADNAAITTKAHYGNSGTWLIDPDGYTIGSDGDMSGAQLSNYLQNTNITISSTQGIKGQDDGNINVNDAVSWHTNTLTLNATKNIYVNNVMAATGNAGFSANYGYVLDMNGNPTSTLTSGTNSDGSIYGIYMALGETGRFSGKLNFNSSGTLRLNGIEYTMINSAESLQKIVTGTYPIPKWYALGSDLDLSSIVDWKALTVSYVNLNGLGHTIDKLKSANGGLFASVTGGYLTNFGVTNANVQVSNVSAGIIAGIIKNSSGIYNLFSTGNINMNWSLTSYGYVGGIAGSLSTSGSTASASNIYSTANVSGGGNSTRVAIGGLVGYNTGNIYDSYFIGNIIYGDAYAVGGLVGFSQGNITKSFSTADITNFDENTLLGKGTMGLTGIGGLVGITFQDFFDNTITDSFSTGNVTYSANKSYSNIGGFVGYQSTLSSISNAYATGNVIGKTNSTTQGYTGGFVGQSLGDISNAYATGDVTGGAYTGGFAGAVLNTITISNAYATGAITNGGASTGGFIGRNTGTLTNVYWNTVSSGIAIGVGTGTGTAVGLNSTQSNSLNNYSGFDTAIWGSSTNGTPILKTIALRIGNLSKTYGDSLSLSDYTVYGLQGGDTMNDALAYDASGHLSYYGKLNAGSYQADALLSSSIYQTIQGTVLINPKTVTIAGASAQDKEYDATAIVSLNANGTIASGVLTGESLSIDTAQAHFNDKNAGNNKTVYLNYLFKDESGNVTGNYITDTTTTASIAKKSVTADFNINDKTYDGTTNASTSGSSITGLITGDDAMLSYSSIAFSDKNAGNTKIVTIGGVTMSGEDASNYTLASTSVQKNATIHQKVLELVGTKEADGSSIINAGNIVANNIQDGDSVSLSGYAILSGSSAGTQNFSDLSALHVNNANYTLVGSVGQVSVGDSNIVLSKIVSGNASISTVDKATTITQNSAKAIIEWLKFSIASGEMVTFIQPDSSSIILNRVVGNFQSIIQGALNANGKVFIINPNGVIFSSTATINTAGLLASTLNIANSDFLNSHYIFTGNGSSGNIINEGDIVIVDSGFAAFISENDVSSTKSVNAENGSVLTASTHKATLNLDASTTNLNTYALDDVSKTVTMGGNVKASLVELAGKTINLNPNLALETGANGTLSLTKESMTIGTDYSADFIQKQLGFRSLNINALNGDITVNNGFNWAVHTLTLSSSKNIWINDVLNGTNTAGFTGIYGNGTNSDGTNYGLYTKMGANDDGTFMGKVNVSNNGIVKLGAKDKVKTYTMINDVASLQAIVGNTYTDYYALGSDIDLSNIADWTPLSLSGTVNGLGHMVENLTSTQGGLFNELKVTNLRADPNNPIGDHGLINSIWDGVATLNNLGVKNVAISVKPTTRYGNYVGALAGQSNGLITNVFATGSLLATTNGAEQDLYLGGLIGSQNGITTTIPGIFNSYTNVNITVNGGAGFQRVGGFVGANQGLIQGSHAKGRITAYGGNFIGGFAGQNNFNANKGIGGRLFNDYADVDIILHGGSIVGGFVGSNMGKGEVSNSYTLGNISGETDPGVAIIGGFAGMNTEFSTIDSSYTKGNINVTGLNGGQAGAYVGGFVGLQGDMVAGVDGSTITNSYATGNVISTGDYVGGFAGRNDYGTLINNSYSTGNVKGRNYVAGFIGINGSKILDVLLMTGNTPGGYFNTVEDHITFHNSNYGLSKEAVTVAMSRNGATVSNSHSSGTVEATADNATVGAFAAENAYGGKVNNNYVTGGGMNQANANGIGLVGANGRGDDYISGALGADRGTSTVSNTKFGSPTEQAQWAAEAAAAEKAHQEAIAQAKVEAQQQAQLMADRAQTISERLNTSVQKDAKDMLGGLLSLLSVSSSKHQGLMSNVDVIHPKFETDVKSITVDGVTYSTEELNEDEEQQRKAQ